MSDLDQIGQHTRSSENKDLRGNCFARETLLAYIKCINHNLININNKLPSRERSPAYQPDRGSFAV